MLVICVLPEGMLESRSWYDFGEDINKKKCDVQDLSFFTALYKSESVSK